MKQAWQNLDLLEKWQDEVRARTYHDLCRAQEVYNMLTVARCMITAASYREESRFGQCHSRLDYPQTDDEHWLGQIAVDRDTSGNPQPRFLPIHYD
jgi:adenylylsulfate reductase subunit A